MLIIPAYVLALLPPLSVWWTHRRCERRDYGILVLSVLSVFVALLMLASSHPLTATWYDGPMSATGILTMQIPLCLLLTTSVTAIPMKMKLVRNVVAFILGEAIL